MKTVALLVIGSLASSLLADDVSGFNFDRRPLDLPPLSLRDALAKRTLPGAPAEDRLHDLAPPGPAPRRARPARRAPTGPSMPIVPPDPRYDYTMRVQTPDETVDYKMLIKRVGPDCRP